MIVIEDRKIDVAKHNDKVIVVAKQGDTASRFVHTEILFEGAKLAMPSTAQVWVNAKRADGESAAYYGTVHTDGTITVPLNHWMLDSAGYLICDVSVLDNGEKLTSLSFAVDVQEATYTDEAVEDDENYDVLTELIIRTESATTEVERLLEEIGDLPTYVVETVEQYLSTHPISGDGVSFDNTGTDIEATTVQGAIIEAYNHGGGTDVPFIEFYGYPELTGEEIEMNAESYAIINALSLQGKPYQAIMYTDYSDLAFAGFYGAYPNFVYFDTATKTHYRYEVNSNGTVGVASVATISPEAKILNGSPTQNTAGDYIGQPAIVSNGLELWQYRGATSEATPRHLWERIAKFSDIPTVPTKTSDLTNDSGFITSSDIANKADKSTIVTSGTAFEAVDNTEYRFGEVASVTMTFPVTIPDRFDIFIAFTSGTTATNITYPQNIKWSGDDITDGQFVPAASKRYSIVLWNDGTAVNGIVRGVA